MKEHKGFGTEMMTPHALSMWVKVTGPGERCCYFSGSALPTEAMVNMTAYALYEAGYLLLVQKRLEHAIPPHTCGKFEYIAYRTKKEWAEPESERRRKVAA